MHLRSGTTLASGSQVPSRASTHSSKNLATKNLLDPIIEDYTTTSSSEDSSEEGDSMSSMSNQPGGSELKRATNSNVDLLGNPTTLLVFKYLNEYGGQVFTNKH